MKIYFIRHGATRGNREHRYVGRTDEGILESEKERLRERGRLLPEPEGMFVSPSRRCLETARALFPEVFSQKGRVIAETDLREMDFGEFEYKNYQELNGNPAYQKFLDSGGQTGFPGGEEPDAFRRRCREAFFRCIRTAQEHQWETVGFTVHGGTIMSIMEGFAEPPGGYFEYQVRNGCGYITELAMKASDNPENAAEFPMKASDNPENAPEFPVKAGNKPDGSAGEISESQKEWFSIKLTIEEEIK